MNEQIQIMTDLIIIVVSWGVWNLGSVAIKHRFWFWFEKVTGNPVGMDRFIREMKKQGLNDSQIKLRLYAERSPAKNLFVDHICFPLIMWFTVLMFITPNAY